MENICDPAHVNWAHHGVVSTRQAEQGMTLAPTAPVADTGFACFKGSAGAGRLGYHVTFTAPMHVRYS